MISREESVKKISFSQSGNKYVEELNAGKLNIKDSGLPGVFEFNRPWELEHNCINCSTLIQLSEQPKKNFYKVERLYDKYFKVSILKSLAKALNDVKVFRSEASEFSFLTVDDFNDKKAISLFIPQITLNYYRCDSCESEYLMRYRQGYPQAPDRSNHKGTAGKLFIDEIMTFCVDSGVKFDELLEKYAK